jgi:hypothetical protein
MLKMINMEHQIRGTFIMRGYHGLSEHETETSLADMLRYSLPDGAVVTVELKVVHIDTWPKCQESNKYGVCATVLRKNGTCPSESSHVTVTEDEEEG